MIIRVDQGYPRILVIKFGTIKINFESRKLRPEASNYQISCTCFVKNIAAKITPSVKMIQIT